MRFYRIILEKTEKFYYKREVDMIKECEDDWIYF